MAKEILLNIEPKQRRLALLKYGILQDLIVERKNSKQITGNIYRGKVTNILHNIQSAFIDIGEEENGFIHISDIIKNTKKFEEMFDMEFDVKYNKKNSLNNKKDISQILKINQPVLVQAVKEPIGTKGARLTSNISIAGRYLVLLPNIAHRGVSKKIEDKKIRDKLKKLIRSFKMPQEMGLICRTASINATKDMLITEANKLLEKWQNIVEKFHKSKVPTSLYEESDLIKRSVITAIDKKLNRILIDHYPTYKYCKKIYQSYSKEHNLKIEFYDKTIPIFEYFKVEEEIEKALDRRIWLNCGGYLYFDKTEAMYTVDVNSGKSLQEKPLEDLEEALVRINLEAAREIARQFKIRNIGGLIICDFIDMRYRKNQKRVLEKLKEHTKEDGAKCAILGMSEFGLVEMTRQRSKESLEQTMLIQCPYCCARGLIKSNNSTAIEMERKLKKVLFYLKEKKIEICCHPELYKFLEKEDLKRFFQIAKNAKAYIEFKTKDTLHLNNYIFTSLKTKKEI